ncbi:MAG: cobalamin-binding protein [Dehalococcoidales bacterium]|nr:cobalamin-binding protein [Dehalococcoidales bacterium]
MKLKWFCIFIIIFSLVLSMVTGCQEQSQPITYTDDLGREVTISRIPQKIVSFGPSITEILFALGLEDKVVGVSDYCDYPDSAKLKPKIGNAFNPSIERIIDLEPDLVLTVKQDQLNDQLDTLGFSFMVLDPENIDGIFRDIELVGEITGTQRKAEEIITDMKDSMSQINNAVADALKKRLFFIVDATDLTLPWTAGSGSFIDALVTMSGGYNIASEIPGAWIQFSLEQIVSSDPEIIIVQTMLGGVPTVSEEELQNNIIWGGMTAVKEGNISFINGDLVSRPGPRIVQGLEEMVKVIHPELFE